MGLKGRDLIRIGWESGPAMKHALRGAHRAASEGVDELAILETLQQLNAAPARFADDPHFGEAARALLEERARESAPHDELGESAPLAIWGREQIDDEAIRQIETACRLPIAVAGAQMPDGHVGYGLPIGGVLATRNAVIPYGVGVDIACRMKITITDTGADRLEGMRDKLRKALQGETRFGVGAEFAPRQRREHDVMDDPLWGKVAPFVRSLRDKAWAQLGTSGSGNHFVEWGELVLEREDLGLEPGHYLALLSHSGSRGFGAQIAGHYTHVAMDLSRLPKAHRRLAWLQLDSAPGEEYWNAMNLAGNYAQANHDLIHRHVVRAAGLKPLVQIENHHNFAWIERHGGQRVVVHRKGATPAGAGVLGIVPGSMADPGYIVRGKGNAASLHSAAHGAGRLMSRKRAIETLTRSETRKILAERGIELIQGGLDESPQVYKPIAWVMQAQGDLVEPVAAFYPKIVLMAAGGPAED